jgi:sugar/nucleoside kinase (ribokinase family)
MKVAVKDTVGCGDSFAAAVVLGHIRDHDILPVMALANAVGAATAMGTGDSHVALSPP